MLTDDEVSVHKPVAFCGVSWRTTHKNVSSQGLQGWYLTVRETLLLGNIRLVVRMKRGYELVVGFLTFADLVQVGIFGLMAAMERFDPFRGYQFSTYATYWIRQVIGREQANLDRSIRIPVHMP